jgi:nitrate/nitrite transporter NarK
MLLTAIGVGLAGGSFAAGIAYVSSWYPEEKQGTALGIFGMGNLGAAVTAFTAPFVLVAPLQYILCPSQVVIRYRDRKRVRQADGAWSDARPRNN